MAIQVDNKKQRNKIPKSVDLLFNFSLILLLLVTGSYFFINFLMANTEEVRKEIEANIEKKKGEIPDRENVENIARDYFNLIEDFKLITSNQQSISLVFNPLEEMIHPGVSISSATVNLENNTMQMSGEAENLVAVGQQFQALKSNKNILSVDLESMIVLREDKSGKILFSFSITFKKDLFKFQQKEE